MRVYAKVRVTRSRDKWYKVGQVLEVVYSPRRQMYETKDGRLVETLDIRSICE